MSKTPFKVGQKVWTIQYGWGKIQENNVGSIYRFMVNGVSYTEEGRYEIDDLVPSMFHDEPVWPDPEPPKPKFEYGQLIMVQDHFSKWKARYFHSYVENGFCCFACGKKPGPETETINFDSGMSLEDYASKFLV